MRDLGKGKDGIKDRYQALLQLVPIVRNLHLPEKRYRGFRIGIPAELDREIQAVVERTGHDFVDILLAAARLYASAREPIVRSRQHVNGAAQSAASVTESAATDKPARA